MQDVQALALFDVEQFKQDVWQVSVTEQVDPLRVYPEIHSEHVVALVEHLLQGEVQTKH